MRQARFGGLPKASGAPYALFLKKYSCSGCIRIVLNSLLVSIRLDGEAGHLVTATTVAGCVAEDVETIATLLTHDNYAGWVGNKGIEHIERDEDMAHGYDVRGFPIELWNLLPPRFSLALTKVLTAADELEDPDYDKAEGFRKLIKAMSKKCTFQD